MINRRKSYFQGVSHSGLILEGLFLVLVNIADSLIISRKDRHPKRCGRYTVIR